MKDAHEVGILQGIAATDGTSEKVVFQQEYNLLPARSRTAEKKYPNTTNWAEYRIPVRPGIHAYRIWEPENKNSVVRIILEDASIYSVQTGVYCSDENTGKLIDILEFELHISNLQQNEAVESEDATVSGASVRNLILPVKWLEAGTGSNADNWKYIFKCPVTIYGGSGNPAMAQEFVNNNLGQASYYCLQIPSGHMYVYKFRLDRLLKLAFIEKTYDYYKIKTLDY